MLQGTLDVFSLDEVLGLLSSANKSGVLNVTGDRGVGTISLAEGQMVAGSASSSPDAIELHDVIFELLRFEEGSFSFDGNAVPEGEPSDIETVLDAAHSRLDEWRQIEAVVPTLDHHLALADSLSTTQVTLDGSEWSAIVAIGEGASVGVVASRLGLGEFDGSKRVKGLIERDLAVLSSTVDESPSAAPAVADPAPPVFETPAPAPTTLDVPVAEPAHVVEMPAEPAPVADEEIPPMPEAPVAPEFGDAPTGFADEEIPPMPEAPVAPEFGDAPTGFADEEIPPMPEPPARPVDGVAIAEEFATPAPTDQIDGAPVADIGSPGRFGGLDPIGSVDMFEPPQRATDGSTGGFSVADDVPPPPAPTIPEAEAIPSLAPPAFDPDDFTANDDPADLAGDPFAVGTEAGMSAVDDEGALTDDGGSDDASEPDKGGSLLMRYLKHNG